jgi:hypothetical protein
MWLTLARLEALARWIPDAAPYLTPDRLGDGRVADGAYSTNITNRMNQAGLYDLARELESAL